MKLLAGSLLFVLILLPTSLFANTLYFPQAVVGGEYTTTITVMNTGTGTVRGQLVFFTQTGTARDDLTTPVTIPAASSTRVTLPRTGALTVVWGMLNAGSETVQGVATFDRRRGDGVLITSAGVLGVEAGNSFLLPVDVTATGDTGVAVGNTHGTSTLNANMRLLRQDGSILDQKTRTLSAREQFASFVAADLFPQLKGTTFSGALLIELVGASPANSLIATALTVKEGLLSALPVIPGGSSTSGATLLFPQVVFGGGYATTFVILNTGGTTVTSTLNFYSQAGENQIAYSANVTIAPNGSARVTLPDKGPLTVVWAEFSPGSGTVRGVATYELREPGGVLSTMVGVLGITSDNSFLLPVDVTATSDTGFAIAATLPTAGITVTLRLIRDDGVLVATLSNVSLAIRNQMAKFVTELFNQIKGTDFKGTLAIEVAPGTPSGALVAMALTLKEGQYSALPVIAGAGGAGSGGGGGGGGGGIVGGGPASDCFVPGFYAKVTTMHLEYTFLGVLSGTSVLDTVHTPNASFEGNGASEWKTNQVTTYPGLGSFATTSSSYQKVDGLEIINYGNTGETAAPAGTFKVVNTPPYRDRRYTLQPGESVTDTRTQVTTSTYPPAPTTTRTSTATATIRYLGQETVTVPAGTFKACKFEYDNGAQSTWEAVGKGVLVKSVSVTNTNQTINTVLTTGSVDGSPIVP